MATGKDVAALAAKEIGTKEFPADSNRVKYNTWYYGKEVSGSGYPWCMAFVQWCYAKAGVPLPFRTASCGALLRWYRANQPECVVSEPRTGDLVIFDFPGGAATDHTGILESASGNTVTSIDGNTGVGNDANGGAVMRRTRNDRYVAAYIRPRELEEDDMKEHYCENVADVPAWGRPTVQKLIDKGILQGTDTGLHLSVDMLRILVWNDRAGVYE